MFRVLIFTIAVLITSHLRAQDPPENPELLPGKKGKDITFVDTSGRQMTLYGVKAPYTVLIIYSTDCEHCMNELPKIYELYKKTAKKKYEIVALNTHHPYYEMSPTKELLKHYHFNWVNGVPTQFQTEKDYFVYATPTIFVMDENKVILSKRVFNTDDLNTALKQLNIIK